MKLTPFLCAAQDADQLSQLYQHVDDIDLFIGGLLERPHAGSLLGRTFLCIVGDQFARLKVLQTVGNYNSYKTNLFFYATWLLLVEAVIYFSFIKNRQNTRTRVSPKFQDRLQWYIFYQKCYRYKNITSKLLFIFSS